MEESSMVENETLGVIIMSISLKVDVQKPKKLTVKQGGDDGDNIRDEITRRRLIRPITNWCWSSNRMYDDY